MTERLSVFVRTKFAARHEWPGAKGEYEFLRHPHRHLFNVEVEVSVAGTDRAVEFLWLKDMVLQFLRNHLGDDLGTLSCEDVAVALTRWLQVTLGLVVVRVEVSEDGENGARLVVEPVA